MKLSKRSLLIIIIMFIASCQVELAFGHSQEPIARTNINQQTDLFERSLKDVDGGKEGLERQITDSKERAEQSLHNTHNIEELTGKSASQIKADVLELENTRADELHQKALAGANGNGDLGADSNITMDDLYGHESSALHLAHARDAERIAGASEKLLGNLLGAIKDLGIDCKTEAGNGQVEPEYHIEIERIKERDASFHQKICQELRNKYECVEDLILKCARPGVRWGAFENKEIQLDGPELFRLHVSNMGWMYSHKWRRRHFGYHLRSDEHTMGQLRQFIAHRTGVPPENIDQRLDIENRPFSIYQHIVQVEGKGYVWPRYKVGYRYRPSSRICLEWQEDKVERCSLK